MTATPRRAITCGSCPRGLVERYDLAGVFPGDPHVGAPAEALPRRPAPRRAAQCRDYFQHSDCGDNGLHVRGEWMAELDEYGDTPRRSLEGL